MRKKNNIIEINGQRYDAISGDVLPGSPANKAKTKPPRHSTAKRLAKHPLTRKPQPSATLMRQAVKKPGPSSKRRFRAQGHIDAPARQPLGGALVNAPAGRLDEKRLKHASQVAKSRLVRHFSSTVITPGNSSASIKPPEPSPIARPLAAAATRQAAHPAKRPRTTAELLDRAVQRADSYQELPRRRTSHSRAKRGLGIGATVALPVLLLGVIINQNLPNVRLQMASAKAGFSASLPGYQPAGYSLGQFQYGDGVVAVQFNAKSGSRGYTLTQKSTPWDSAALLVNFVAPADPNYRTIQDAGRTVYLYGGHDATWINGGIWYQIQTNGTLSDSQLIKLAASL